MDRLHGTFTIGNGRVRTEDMTLSAGEWKLSASGWSSLDGSVDYVFEEEALTRRYRELVAERPELRALIGDAPRFLYRKPAGGPGGFEVPWLKPEKLVKSLVGSGLLEGGIGDRLKDLLRRDR